MIHRHVSFWGSGWSYCCQASAVYFYSMRLRRLLRRLILTAGGAGDISI